LTIAMMPFWIASGSLSQRSTINAKSQGFRANCAKHNAKLWSSFAKDEIWEGFT